MMTMTLNHQRSSPQTPVEPHFWTSRYVRRFRPRPPPSTAIIACNQLSKGQDLRQVQQEEIHIILCDDYSAVLGAPNVNGWLPASNVDIDAFRFTGHHLDDRCQTRRSHAPERRSGIRGMQEVWKCGRRGRSCKKGMRRPFVSDWPGTDAECDFLKVMAETRTKRTYLALGQNSTKERSTCGSAQFKVRNGDSIRLARLPSWFSCDLHTCVVRRANWHYLAQIWREWWVRRESLTACLVALGQVPGSTPLVWRSIADALSFCSILASRVLRMAIGSLPVLVLIQP